MVEEVTQSPTPVEPASTPVVEGEDVEPQLADNSLVPATDTECATVGQRFREALQQTEAEHLDRLRECVRVQTSSTAAPRTRGPQQQQSRRRLEQVIRQDAVDFYHRLKMQGGTLEEAAKLLCMSARTLRQWDYDSRLEPLHILPLGRPLARSEPAQRVEVLDFLKDQGAGVGVPKLRQAFPGMARAALAELLHGHRQELSAARRDSARVLHWRLPGRAWAIDFAAPSATAGVLPPIDGHYPYLCAVRDLASGYPLCWLPVSDMTAAIAQQILAWLFAQHGAPLVLKMDNGPAFRADETKRFLEQAGVLFLYSPPHWPGYNGAIEAAIGSLKRRTERQAAQHGRPGLWTIGDVEAARLQASTSQPRRLHGLTPAQVWAQRTPPSDVERVRFELTVERQRFVARNERGIEQDAVLDHWQQGKLDRKAIERALVEHGCLLFRGRRLPLTITAGKVTYFV